MSTTQTTRCAYCAANAGATAARQEHGAFSPQHLEALNALRPHLENARLGRAHSEDCPDRIATPMVRFR